LPPFDINDIGEVYPVKTNMDLTFDFNINSNKILNGFIFGIYIKDIFDSKREEPVRNTSNLGIIKSNGRNIIGKIIYEF